VAKVARRAATSAMAADLRRHIARKHEGGTVEVVTSPIAGARRRVARRCSKLSKKPYFPLFKMAGFVGFDGDWK
jgi:hypothetical protein